MLFFPRGIIDIDRDISALASGAGSSDAWAGGWELGVVGVGSFIKGTGGVCARIGGRGGTSFSCGNEGANALINENASEILLESLHSTGDLIAMILVGEGRALSKAIGDEGAEDTRLIVLSCGKTETPHLLVGRSGAGVSSGGEIGELGDIGGGCRVAISADS